MSLRTLRPEHSVSTNSTTSALILNIIGFEHIARIILNELKRYFLDLLWSIKLQLDLGFGVGRGSILSR